MGGMSLVLFLFVETTYLHRYIITVFPWDTVSRLFGSTEQTLYKMKGIIFTTGTTGQNTL